MQTQICTSARHSRHNSAHPAHTGQRHRALSQAAPRPTQNRSRQAYYHLPMAHQWILEPTTEEWQAHSGGTYLAVRTDAAAFHFARTVGSCNWRKPSCLVDRKAVRFCKGSALGRRVRRSISFCVFPLPFQVMRLTDSNSPRLPPAGAMRYSFATWHQ
jgi:hypothetical protein